MDFELLWNMYPRKVCKKPSRQQWDKLTELDQQEALQALPAHIQLWEATNTEKEFIPHLRTWLYQERWTDEIELPKPKEVVQAWWTSDAGILAKGREVGLEARPGETMFEFKGRVNEAIRKSA